MHLAPLAHTLVLIDRIARGLGISCTPHAADSPADRVALQWRPYVAGPIGLLNLTQIVERLVSADLRGISLPLFSADIVPYLLLLADVLRTLFRTELAEASVAGSVAAPVFGIMATRISK